MRRSSLTALPPPTERASRAVSCRSLRSSISRGNADSCALHTMGAGERQRNRDAPGLLRVTTDPRTLPVRTLPHIQDTNAAGRRSPDERCTRPVVQANGRIPGLADALFGLSRVEAAQAILLRCDEVFRRLLAGGGMLRIDFATDGAIRRRSNLGECPRPGCPPQAARADCKERRGDNEDRWDSFGTNTLPMRMSPRSDSIEDTA